MFTDGLLDPLDMGGWREGIKRFFTWPWELGQFTRVYLDAVIEKVRREKIDHIEEDNLPTFSQLYGMAPNATNGLPAEDFIAKIRSEE